MAPTPGGVLLGLTVRIVTTRERVARVDAAPGGGAGKVAGAVGVFGALHNLYPGACAKERVSHSARRTLTFVGANFIDTNGILAALFLPAFIDVHTASGAPVDEARQTFAPRWIGGFTLAVDAAGEGLTRTLALGVVLVVHKVRWRTDTFSWLNALFVFLAVAVSRTLNAGHEAARGERVAGVARGAAAFEAAHEVVTLCVEGTAGTSIQLAHGTLIHVLARAVGLRGEALGTCTVTEAALDGDTLSPRRTLVSQRTVGQHTVAVHDAVGWKASAF